MSLIFKRADAGNKASISRKSSYSNVRLAEYSKYLGLVAFQSLDVNSQSPLVG